MTFLQKKSAYIFDKSGKNNIKNKKTLLMGHAAVYLIKTGLSDYLHPAGPTKAAVMFALALNSP